MQGLTGRHFNDVIGLTIMLVMIAALVASQADATVHEGILSDSGYSAPSSSEDASEITNATIVRADLEVQVDLARLIGAGFEAASGGPIRELLEIRIKLDE
jgi:hypothetical protein